MGKVGRKCMKDSEFVKKILGLVREDEYRLIISKACSKGFVVPGFSNNKRTSKLNIPITLVTNSVVLNARKQIDRCNYEILFDVIKSIAEERNEPEDLLYYAVRWSEDSETHEEIEKKLVDMEREKNNIKNETDACYTELDKSETEEEECGKLKETNLRLQNEIERLREKARKNKEELQYNKIVISNIKQQNAKLEKENEKLKNENEELKEDIQRCTSEYETKAKKADDIIIEQKKEINELQNLIDDLKQYKAAAPKILCFAKNPSKLVIPGYNIYFVSRIDEQIQEYIKESYDGIWYVRKGFNHANLLSIKQMISEVEILQARDENDLIEKIKGGRK